jgi:tetratricopeptide (TPR) repeat protein
MPRPRHIPPAPPPPTTGHWSLVNSHSALLPTIFLALLLISAVLFSYQPAWNAGFIWDDDEYVTHNPLLTAPDGLQRIWFSTDSPSQYFPLVYTNFRAQHALWGLNPAGFHWVNILLHAVNALLLWRLLARLAIPGAWFGATLFALHPLQVESVAWITELKNVQSLFFTLLVLLAWERFTADTPAQPASASGSSSAPAPSYSLLTTRYSLLYLAALACDALALFSKTTACTIPAALVLILWLRHRPITLTRWLQIAPFVLFGLIMGLVSVWWERNQQGTDGAEFSYGAVDRVLIAARALCFYLGKLLWPENLTFSYPLWPIDPRSPSAWTWFLPLIAVAAAILLLRRRIGRGPETALVFFVATLLPLLGFFMLYTFRYTFVADHYVYVALIGPAALAGAGLAWLVARLRAVHSLLPPVLCAGLVLGFATLSWRQSRMYTDLRTLWETTIARNPDSFMGHNNLGALHLREGRVEQAVASFERALVLKPRHTHALANLANARLAEGKTAEALALFQQVLALAPDDAKAHADLGQALETTGSATDAESHYRRAIALDDTLAEGHFLLGRRLLTLNRAADATPHFERALALYDGYAEAHYHLGLVRLAEERPGDATNCFRRTLELTPDHVFALNNLGLLLIGSGHASEAEPLHRRAAQLRPTDPTTRHQLARTLLILGRPAHAIDELREVMRLSPELVPARLELAQTQIELGRFADAAATLEAHLARYPQDYEARHGLGRVLLAAGRPTEAAAAFRQVLASAPDHADARADLERLSTTTPPPL